MTVISMILPFLLFGNVVDKLPGVGFKREHFKGRSSISSERMNTKTVLETTTRTNVSVTGQSEIETTAQVKVEISTSTSFKCVSILEDNILSTKIESTTVAEVLSTLLTNIPGNMKALQSITRTTILIINQGRVNTTVRPTTKNTSLFSINSEDYSVIEGSTINMKGDVKQSESTFSALVRSATEAVIDTTMTKGEDECSDSKVQAKTVSEYEDLTETRAEGKTEVDVKSEKLTSMETTTIAGARTEMFKDGSILVNIKARTMELSSTTTNKHHVAPETKGRSTVAYGASSTMMDFEMAFVNQRTEGTTPNDQNMVAFTPSIYQSSVSYQVSSHSLVDVMTSTVTGSNSSVKTTSSSSSFSQYNTEATASGKMNSN